MTHFVGVHCFAIGHVHSVIVEHFAAFRSRLATAQTSTIGPPSGWQLNPAREPPADSVRDIEMDQMIRFKERVERAVAYLVKAQIVPLLGSGCSAIKDFVRGVLQHNPPSRRASEPLDVVELAGLHHVVLYSSPRDIPRDFTFKPVALATMACSKLIFNRRQSW